VTVLKWDCDPHREGILGRTFFKLVSKVHSCILIDFLLQERAGVKHKAPCHQNELQMLSVSARMPPRSDQQTTNGQTAKHDTTARSHATTATTTFIGLPPSQSRKLQAACCCAGGAGGAPGGLLGLPPATGGPGGGPGGTPVCCA
jgi:hypothetical protein